MSVVVEVTVAADAFALDRTLESHPEMVVEAERLATHSPEWALPFLWASGGDFESFTETMEADPTVQEVHLVEEVGGERLYKIRWTDAVLDLIAEMIDHEAIILNAKGRGGRWQLELRFAEDSQLSEFREYFAEQGQAFVVERLYHPSEPRQREFNLTPAQRETLVTAVRGGYFDVPREQSMEELARALEISSNAVSQRLRRGSANLVRSTLTIGADGDSD